MPIPTIIAGSEIGKRPEFALTEQEYYDRFLRPSAEKLRGEAIGASGAGIRGARQTQRQIVGAQLGGEMSSLGDAAVSGMAPAFRRAVQSALAAANQSAEAMTRQKMLERQRKRALGATELATVSSIAAGLESMIPFAGPYISAAEGVAGGIGQAVLSGKGTGGGPLQTVSFDPAEGAGAASPKVSPGGGGLYDLYNLTYG